MDRRGSGIRVGKQTRFQLACQRLIELAHELGPDAKLPTVLQLRDHLGISIATLNSVLNELEAQQIVRRKHGIGIYVDTRIRHRRVCLLSDPSFFRSSDPTFWGALIEQVRSRTEQAKESFSLHFTLDVPPVADTIKTVTDPPAKPLLPEGLVDDLRHGRIDGVLGIGLPQAIVAWIEYQHLPLVSFAGSGGYTVDIENRVFVRQGVESLLKEGCHHLAFFAPIAPHRYTEPNREHAAAPIFREMVAAAGIPFDPDLLWDNRHLIPAQGGIHTLTHQEQGYHAVMELFGPHLDPIEWPDGIFSTDDRMTQGALSALQRLGVPVGDTVKIATQTMIGSAALLGAEDRIIRIEVDPEEIVGELFGMLERLMQGEALPESTVTVRSYLRLPGDV